MTDTQKLKYDLAMSCAFIKTFHSGVTNDRQLLETMTENFKEFYRGCNDYKSLSLNEAIEYMNQD